MAQGRNDNSLQVISGSGKKGGAVRVPAATFGERINKWLRNKRFQNKDKRQAKITRLSKRAIRFARKAGRFAKPECRPSIDIYLDAKDSIPGNAGVTASRRSAEWLCNARIDYTEKNFSVQNNDLRVFVEGAEVTQYVRGTVTWNIESTGGMNTASFTLNNNHDAFIITPQNCCANVNKSAWRLHGRTVQSRGKFFSANPGRENIRVDEAAKYTIYRLKYRAVNPGKPESMIDSFTGTWLFPLNPYSSIINKHDAVRIFTRLPHVSGVSRKSTKEYYDLWIPAFTGFVSGYSWEDNRVTADRQMTIQCYDYRGLLDRMRVRIVGNPTRAQNIDKQRIVTGPKKGEPTGPFPSLFSSSLSKAQRNVLGASISKEIREIFAILGIIDFIDRFNDKNANHKVILNCKSSNIGADTACVRQQLEKVKKESRGEVKQILDQLGKLTKKANELLSLDGKKREAKTKRKKVNGAPQIFMKVTGSLKQKKGSAEVINEAVDFLKGDAIKATDLLSSDNILNVDELLALEKLGVVKFKIGKIPKVDNPREVVGKWISRRLSVILGRLDANTKQRLSALYVGGNTNGELKPINDLNSPINTISTLNDVRGQTGSPKRKLGELRIEVGILNDQLARLGERMKVMDKEVAAFFSSSRSQAVQRRKQKAKQILQEIARKRADGTSQTAARVGGPVGSVADIYLNYPTFDRSTAGLFSDLVKRIEKGNPHPLANMSFEQAVEWLCSESTNIVRGARQEIVSYSNKGDLEKWNRICLFGQIGRPLTFHEVTLIGETTITSDTKAPFNPVNAFLNFLLPKKGTGAESIVQQHVGAAAGQATTHTYETRKSLLDQICTLLDYQFYVSPMGDLTFEFPNYNVLPLDFGNTFKGAYRLDRELITSNISEESTDLNTAWVITGLETDKKLETAVKGSPVAEHKLGTISIMAPILAKRIGVRVSHININLPGVGALLRKGGSKHAAQYQLFMYGLFQIQREWGRAHKVEVTHPFRPYILPNRPMHVVHRQRLGLVQTVTYSMTPPGGECSTRCQLGYVRWLNRDGTFRHIAGGPRMPIDYTQFTDIGSIKVNIKDRAGVFSRNPRFGKDSLFANPDTVPASSSSSASSALTQKFTKSASATGDAVQRTFSQKGRTLTASTAGAGSAASAPSTVSTTVTPSGQLKVKPGSQTGAGKRISRKRVDPGNTGSQTIDTKKGGLVVSSQDSAKKSSKVRVETRGDQKTSTYDISKLFYDPFPFFTYRKGVTNLNSWGWVRVPTPGSLRKEIWSSKERKAGFHSGVDLFGTPVRRSEVYAPIRFHNLVAVINVGPSQGRRKTIPWKEVISSFTPAGVTTSSTRNLHPSGAERFLVTGKNRKPAIFVKDSLTKTDQKTGLVETKTTYNAKMYPQELQAWKKSGKPKIRRNSGRAGMMITGTGWVSIPKGANIAGTRLGGKRSGKLLCQLDYIHLDEIGSPSTVKDNTGKSNRGFYGIQVRNINADPDRKHPIGYVGVTGNTAYWHLHLTMRILLTKNFLKDAGYVAAVKEILKANNEFLSRQLALKLTATGGQLKEDPLNSTLSDNWKKKLKGKIKVDGKIVDVNTAKAIDVIEALKKSAPLDFRQKFRNRTDFKTVSGKWAVQVNPLFFFRPEQVIQGPKQRSLSAGSRIKQSGRRAGFTGDRVDFICKGRSKTGLNKIKRQHVIKRSESNRKTTGASARSAAALKKRREQQKKLSKDQKTQTRQIKRKLAQARPEQVETTLHAAVEQHLKYEREGGALAGDRGTLPQNTDFSTLNNIA